MASVSAEIRLPDWLATMALPPAPVSDEACMRLAIAAARVASGLDAVSTMPIRTVPVWSEMPAEVVEITAA